MKILAFSVLFALSTATTAACMDTAKTTRDMEECAAKAMQSADRDARQAATALIQAHRDNPARLQKLIEAEKKWSEWVAAREAMIDAAGSTASLCHTLDRAAAYTEHAAYLRKAFPRDGDICE